MISSREEIADTIRMHGHRATPQRILIYEAMWRAGSHPNVSDIYEYAIKTDPSISLATVYKTLHLFSQIGLVRETGFRDGSTRYDPDTEFHIHLVCNRCGKVEDFSSVSLDEIGLNMDNREGFQVLSYDFEVRGLCQSCQKSQ